jgi:AcrR family transcriptional regulator
VALTLAVSEYTLTYSTSTLNHYVSAMKTIARLSGEKRRTAIIQAVRRVFAEKGFHGTTTRELAQAAGVSEALLFKHFPSKEALFTAMLEACCTKEDIVRFERLRSQKPSSTTLVMMIHYLVSFLLERSGPENEELAIQDRLMLRSLAEDGEFARHVHERIALKWIPAVVDCMRAAEAAGDTEPGPVRPDVGGWFAHSLPLIVHLLLLPANPVIEFRVRREALLEQALWFILRGIGLKEEALRRLLNKKALAALDETSAA